MKVSRSVFGPLAFFGSFFLMLNIGAGLLAGPLAFVITYGLDAMFFGD